MLEDVPFTPDKSVLVLGTGTTTLVVSRRVMVELGMLKKKAGDMMLIRSLGYERVYRDSPVEEVHYPQWD